MNKGIRKLTSGDLLRVKRPLAWRRLQKGNVCMILSVKTCNFTPQLAMVTMIINRHGQPEIVQGSLNHAMIIFGTHSIFERIS